MFENIEQRPADERMCMTGPTGGMPRHQGPGVIKMPHGIAPIQIGEYRPAVQRPQVSSHSLFTTTTTMLRASTALPSPVPVDSTPGGMAGGPSPAVHNAPTPTPTESDDALPPVRNRRVRTNTTSDKHDTYSTGNLQDHTATARPRGSDHNESNGALPPVRNKRVRTNTTSDTDDPASDGDLKDHTATVRVPRPRGRPKCTRRS